MLTGMLVGLIIGVGVVVGVMMFFNRASTPFSNMDKQVERQQTASASTPDVTLLEPGSGLQEVKPTASMPPEAAPAVSLPPPVSPPASLPAEAPRAATSQNGERFDFYKILPGKIDALPGVPEAAPSHTVTAKNYSLQAGAFANEGEADNLKAKLALMGVEASIHTAETDKGILHRVRIGPFARQTDAERVRAQLKAGGVASDLLKP
ncbi:SPOR domain-containing protein [Craterilacuibacter sp.]|uniref:SPOR domain-containing protein n=1 Tax=Craterilacuibacter sp. TaxID=2870909 RepID=UPI003F3977FF